jgi:PGF-CTERM protein
MTDVTRTVVVAAVLALAVCTGAALGSAATTTTTDEQANETATVSFDDQQFDGESVTVESATLPDGGFAVVYDSGVERVGHSEYLEPGDHENLTVSLNASVEGSQVLMVTLYRNNGTEAYNASEDSQAYQTDQGVDVSDVAHVSSETQTRGDSDRGASGDETTTATNDDTTTDEALSDGTTTEAAMDDESGEETTEASSGGVPGFTPITAVVALLAAALIASRRR